MASFGARLTESFARYGQLCVGIDPHSWLLSEWGLPDTAGGAREFGMRVVEASANTVGIIKPQVAFFERFGSAGYHALEDVFQAARATGLLIIADAKRGDVGSSVEAYGHAWLTPGHPLEADALTVSAFQGFGSLDAPARWAEENGKGLFVLAATSNPEAAVIQQAKTASGKSVAASIAAEVTDWNREQSADALGSIGLVLGATINADDYGLNLDTLTHTPILAPGFGHQGARIDQMAELFGPAASSVLISASRSILSAGPYGIADAVSRHAAEVKACRA